MRSERLTILVTPEEKTEIAEKAARLGITSSEFLRLAADAFDESGAEPLLIALAEQIEEAVASTNARLDEAHDFVTSTLAEMRRRREHAPEAEAA